MCNGKCICGREDNGRVTPTSEKNISEDTAASYNNSQTPATDIDGVVVD